MEYNIIGLGNPEGYEGTRHNVGKDMLEGIARELGIPWEKIEGGKKATLSLENHILNCIVSDGYMNETGQDLAPVIAKKDPAYLAILHDEVDFEPGVIKVTNRKRTGTHRGVRSIAETLGAEGFTRVRIGVGREGVLKKYVLDALQPEEAKKIAEAIKRELPEVLNALVQQNKLKKSTRLPSSPRQVDNDPSAQASASEQKAQG